MTGDAGIAGVVIGGAGTFAGSGADTGTGRLGNSTAGGAGGSSTGAGTAGAAGNGNADGSGGVVGFALGLPAEGAGGIVGISKPLGNSVCRQVCFAESDFGHWPVTAARPPSDTPSTPAISFHRDKNMVWGLRTSGADRGKLRVSDPAGRLLAVKPDG